VYPAFYFYSISKAFISIYKITPTLSGHISYQPKHHWPYKLIISITTTTVPKTSFITGIITTTTYISTIFTHFFTPYTVYEKSFIILQKKARIHPQTQMYPYFEILI